MDGKWIGLLLAALVTAACQDGGSLSARLGRRQGGPRPPVPVKTVTVGMAEELPGRTYTGEAEPARSTVLTAPYGGTLTALRVRKGQSVGSGQVVCEIRSQSVESALEVAEASLAQAQDAQARLDRVYASGAIPEVQKVDVGTQLAKAEAAARAARKVREDGAVKAPYRGIIGETYADPGVDVLPGQRIALLLDLSSLDIRIEVHENDIASVTPDTPALVSVPALDLEDIPARVSERSYLASPLSRSFPCKLKLSRQVPGLMPGMAVKVRFSAAPAQGTPKIVVPAAAVQLDTEGGYVWTVRDGRVEKRRITSGGYSGLGVLVSGGLEPGDKVIVEGYQKVSTGMLVTE